MGSKFQRILWSVAGAELDILEKCRTDHKRFAAIGATILMTTFIAFCAGTSAALYFTQSGNETSGSWWWAILFGLIWALLIFCIDRSLVITLKKDPSAKKQKIWVPLLSRSALACIIAFMVSIPLELVIFEDFIAEEKFEFDIQNQQILSDKAKKANGEDELEGKIQASNDLMARLDSLNNGLRSDVSSLNSQIQEERNKKGNPITSEYKNARKTYDDYTRQIEGINRDVKIVQSNLRTAYSKQDSTRILKKLELLNTQIQNLESERAQHWNIMKREIKAWDDKIDKKIKELEGERDIAQNQFNENVSNYNKEAKRRDVNRDAQQESANERIVMLEKFEQTIKNGNHFIQNYRILEYAVWKRDTNGDLEQPTELFFLWMIRLLFFIIEILPTIVKIVTPIGSYDRMVQAEEKQVMTYLGSDEYVKRIRNMHDIELKSREEQLQKQHQIELELKSEILERVKNAQIEVADATIAKWKESEMSKVTPKAEESESV